MRGNLLRQKPVARDDEFLDHFGGADAARHRAVVENNIALRHHARLARLVRISDRPVDVAIDVGQRDRSGLIQHTHRSIGKKAADGMDVGQTEARPSGDNFLVIGVAEIAGTVSIDRLISFRHAAEGIERVDLDPRQQPLRQCAHEKRGAATIGAQLYDMSEGQVRQVEFDQQKQVHQPLGRVGDAPLGKTERMLPVRIRDYAVFETANLHPPPPKMAVPNAAPAAKTIGGFRGDMRVCLHSVFLVISSTYQSFGSQSKAGRGSASGGANGLKFSGMSVSTCSRLGIRDVSQPPPRPWISATLASSRLCRILTAVCALARAAVCATTTLVNGTVPALYWLKIMRSASCAEVTAISCAAACSARMRSAASWSSTCCSPVSTAWR